MYNWGAGSPSGHRAPETGLSCNNESHSAYRLASKYKRCWETSSADLPAHVSSASFAPIASSSLRWSADPSALFARENGKRPWDLLDAGDVRFAEVCAICLRAVLTASSGPLDAQDRTALHLLCSRHGRLLRLDAEYVAPFLVKEAASALDTSGGTPLHSACRDVPCDGDLDVSFLTRVAGLGGASIQNASGWTPLHIFVQKHALVLGVREDDAPAWRALRVLIDAHPAAAGATRVHAGPRSPGGPQAVARGAEASINGRIRRVCTGFVRLGCTGEAPTAGKQARRAPFRRPSVFWSRDKMSRRNDSASPRSWARRRCRPCWCRFRGAGRRRPSCSCRVPRSPDARASGAPVIGRERASEPLWTSRGVAAPHTGSF